MGNKNKQTRGIWIPEEIKVDKKLDWTNKALLSEIYSLCELPDGCIASDNHFGKLLGIGRTSVNKRVNKLEDLGYITARNHYKGNQCIGRTITRGSSVRKHTLVPEVVRGSSPDINLVVPEVEVGSSVENTINSLTNSDVKIQDTISDTGVEIINLGNTTTSYMESKYEDLAEKLVEESSLGIDIFFYLEDSTIKLFRDAVSPDEYNRIYPLLKEFQSIGKTLYGR